ncbi:SRPBCC family protein [Streptomyces orinoci]|uniref:SRPBCC domain-containing protein n=1 Tax=Streptomyces orinoci TaxID=67339 RepID=A0ABV3K1D1_STRON|nr:SRPBCC domain-containing protein [Streptomyces orinoci]
MEHEVFVPFPVEAVRRVLSDPGRVARCVPGLQQDAGEPGDAGDAGEHGGALAGRLRVRIGGSTITYRGELRLTERDGRYELSGEGTEARGAATVTLVLRAEAEPVPGGTRLACTGSVDSAGRLAEFDEKTVQGVARRLLDRFGAALAEELRGEVPEVSGAELPGSGLPGSELSGPEISGPEPVTADGLEADVDAIDTEAVEEALLGEEEPPAEAAHARRTMIGRSAEEVDHAPPRGRYAPVPAPETVTGRAALRWAAPAAVLLASAVVVGRVLRRRR